MENITRVKIKESKQEKPRQTVLQALRFYTEPTEPLPEMLWIYSINSCTAYTEIKPHALFKTKLHISNTV